MDGQLTEELLAEYLARRRDEPQDPQLQCLDVAILVEDLFDVVIPDGQLDVAHLGNAAAIRRTLERLVGSD